MKPDWKRFVSFDVLMSIVLSLMLYPFLYMLCEKTLLAGAIAGVFGSGLVRVRRHYLYVLGRRIEEEDPIEWTVEINGVSVGTMTDSEYAAIRRHVYSDACNYFDQLTNAGTVLLRFVDYVYVAVPLAIFWIGLAVAIGSPELFTGLVADFQSGGAAAVAAAALLLLKVVGSGALLMAVAHVVFGFSRYGFADRFESATKDIVRRRFGVAADGRMVLVRWDQGTPLFHSEWAVVQKSLSARPAKRER